MFQIFLGMIWRFHDFFSSSRFNDNFTSPKVTNRPWWFSEMLEVKTVFNLFFFPFYYSLRWISHFPPFNIFSFIWAFLRQRQIFPKVTLLYSFSLHCALYPVVKKTKKKTGYCRAVLTMKEVMEGATIHPSVWQWTEGLLLSVCATTWWMAVHILWHCNSIWHAAEITRILASGNSGIAPWIHGD